MSILELFGFIGIVVSVTGIGYGIIRGVGWIKKVNSYGMDIRMASEKSTRNFVKVKHEIHNLYERDIKKLKEDISDIKSDIMAASRDRTSLFRFIGDANVDIEKINLEASVLADRLDVIEQRLQKTVSSHGFNPNDIVWTHVGNISVHDEDLEGRN